MTGMTTDRPFPALGSGGRLTAALSLPRIPLSFRTRDAQEETRRPLIMNILSDV